MGKMLKTTTLILLAFVLFFSFSSCDKVDLTEESDATRKPNIQNIQSDVLSIEKVENIPENFILGMDASCVPSLEASGVKYYDCNGNKKDVFEILSKNGINYIRVRVWNNPFDAQGFGYGGGNCDIENAIKIGVRAAKYGMKLLVDFHYSDFWADPGKQKAPKEWENLEIEEKTQAIYDYTKDCLGKLQSAGVVVGMVQIGNETNGAFCGENSEDTGGWERIGKLMNAGVKAVRDLCPTALVAVHFTNPEKTASFESYGKNLEHYDVDYDVFATSYYPFWHGPLDNLAKVLSDIAKKYKKKVMVAETSYAYTLKDSDFHTNTIGSGAKTIEKYSFTKQGQASFVRDVVDTLVNKTTNGIGVFYWEGTWISVGNDSYEKNLSVWEKYGSGWATSYAAEYDPEDAGKWYGGCAVENQAFFDEKGKATEALKVFSLLKSGNVIEKK